MSQGVSLETIARQLERVLERIGAIEDKLAGLISMAARSTASRSREMPSARVGTGR